MQKEGYESILASRGETEYFLHGPHCGGSRLPASGAGKENKSVQINPILLPQVNYLVWFIQGSFLTAPNVF